MGILAAIAIPRFSNVTDNAKTKANLAEHRILVSAVEMFRASSSTMALPATLTDLDAYVEGGLAKIGTLKDDTYSNANGTHKITLTTDKTTIVSTPNVTSPTATTTEISK